MIINLTIKFYFYYFNKIVNVYYYKVNYDLISKSPNKSVISNGKYKSIYN